MTSPEVGVVTDVSMFTSDEKDALNLLVEIKQDSLIRSWNEMKISLEEKKEVLSQVKKLDKQYRNGGLRQYYSNACALIQESFLGSNPYSGYTPLVPDGITLSYDSPEMHEYESLGAKEFPYCAFVLVAGGMGERLGYNGIKIELPVNITTNTMYIEYYIQTILAMQQRARVLRNDPTVVLPLAIMTSNQTHLKTVQLLEHFDYFEIKSQITIIKQDLVAAFKNNECEFAMEKGSQSHLIREKPHGHGDVHALLYSQRVVIDWAKKYKSRWLVFLQDTNALCMYSLPSAIGVSARFNFAMNTITVPRKAGQAIGSIAKLSHDSDPAKNLTINVEYNQLGPMLQHTGEMKGDVPDATGHSPFPGNTNTFILRVDLYNEVMEESKGQIPEFVNPKYTDDTRTTFKKATRLECMMQDYPKLLVRGPTEASSSSFSTECGITCLPLWATFHPVKSNIPDSIQQSKALGTSFSPCHGEHAYYNYMVNLLNTIPKHSPKCKMDIEVAESKSVECPVVSYAGVPVLRDGPKIVLHPSFGVTLAEVQSRFGKNCDVKISRRSSLILKGNVFIEGKLHVDGCLELSAINKGTRVVVKNVVVNNDGSRFKQIDINDHTIEEKYRIRGYVREVKYQHVVQFDDGKEHVLVKYYKKKLFHLR